ncbi:MAG: hypothetical protein H0W68_12095 [Gemmatimonadaceae bacterium]|nr:hypothetical protein [Gemmatimonadaceae bacterium]
MKTLTIATSLILAPAAAFAQASVQAQARSSTEASISAPRLSADAQGRIDANLRVAREKKLPEAPIQKRVAEGRAKGASDAQIAAASGRTLVDLEASHEAMVGAGRRAPSDEEVTRGSQLLARGYTSAQLEAVTRTASSDRSLVVAFETLTSLRAAGVSSAKAVARIESLLTARASDAELQEAGAAGRANGAVGAALGVGTSIMGNASSGVSTPGAAHSGAAVGAGITGGLTGSAVSAGAAAGVTGAAGAVLGRKP